MSSPHTDPSDHIPTSCSSCSVYIRPIHRRRREHSRHPTRRKYATPAAPSRPISIHTTTPPSALSSLARHHVHSCLEQVTHASRRADAWIPGVPNPSLPTPSTRPTVSPGLQDFPIRHPRLSTALAPKLDNHGCLSWTLAGLVGYIDYPGGAGEEFVYSQRHSSRLKAQLDPQEASRARSTKQAPESGELTSTSSSSSSSSSSS
jgi:hypothetical protein